MSLLHSPTQNHLLAMLPKADLERLSPHLELVPMVLGDMLYEPEKHLQYAYFPTTSVISLHYVTESGASAEAAGVGKEGVVGVALFMSGAAMSSSAVVVIAGYAYRLERYLLKEEFERAGAFQRLVLSYIQTLMAQVMQTAICNRYHTIDQQLCRWLLVTLDRMPSRDLVMTQGLIAYMLGVRREGITEAAGKLQYAGFIRYRRGHITVLDRAGLETQACECYAVVRKELDRLLLTRR